MKEQTVSNLKKLKSFHNGSFGADIDRAIQALEQQPKTGEWIKKIEPYEAEPFILWECSKCHMKVRGSMKSDYCPNCGSYNGGGEE